MRRFFFYSNLKVGIILLLCLSLTSCKKVDECYEAADVGSGKTIMIKSEVKLNDNSNKFLSNEPKKHQIIAWKDTGLYTVGVKYDQNENLVTEPIVGKVSGGWYPWGGRSGLSCEKMECNKCNKGICDKYTSNCITSSHGADHVGLYIKPIRGKEPCLLTNGMGLYGLISIQNSGSIEHSNPNENAISADVPNTELFRTFHVGAYSNSDGKFTIPHNIVCESVETEENYKCVKQSVSGVQGNTISLGRLYLKILDSYYGDNEDHKDGYKITFYNGVYYMGFITEMMSFLQETLKDSSQILYNNFIKYSLDIIKVFLLLYITITSIMFLIGSIKVRISEFIIVIFKTTLIATLLSPSSYTFFKTHFFDIFQSVTDGISDIIVNSAFFVEQSGRHMSGKVISTANFGKGAGYLVIYDDYINSLFSDAITAKIWSLFFTPKILYIIPIYICITILMLVILKALMLYALSFLQTGILIAVFPFCLTTILFQNTKEIFEKWLQYMLASSLIVILVTTLTSLMFVFLRTYFDKFFEYSVCWENIFLFIHFWSPTDFSELNNAVNTVNYFATLFYTAIFYILLNMIPNLVDSLSNSVGLGTVSTSYDYGMNIAKDLYENFKETSRINSIWKKIKSKIEPKIKDLYARSFSPMGIYSKYKTKKEIASTIKKSQEEIKEYNLKSVDRILESSKKANEKISELLKKSLGDEKYESAIKERREKEIQIEMKEKNMKEEGTSTNVPAFKEEKQIPKTGRKEDEGGIEMSTIKRKSELQEGKIAGREEIEMQPLKRQDDRKKMKKVGEEMKEVREDRGRFRKYDDRENESGRSRSSSDGGETLLPNRKEKKRSKSESKSHYMDRDKIDIVVENREGKVDRDGKEIFDGREGEGDIISRDKEGRAVHMDKESLDIDKESVILEKERTKVSKREKIKESYKEPERREKSKVEGREMNQKARGEMSENIMEESKSDINVDRKGNATKERRGHSYDKKENPVKSRGNLGKRKK